MRSTPSTARSRPDRGAGRHRSLLPLASLLLLPLAVLAQPMTWKYEYDAVGNLTKVTDPRGQVTDYVYDALSRRTQIKQPIPAAGSPQPQIGLGYDGLDQLKTVTDPRNLVTTYTTDGLGHTTTQTSPDTGATVQTFNAAGLLATRRDARNVTATYTYDAGNRLTRIVHAGTGFTTLTDTWVYDQGPNALGKLTAVTYSGGSTSWTYDGFGRPDSQTLTLGSLTLKLQKTYDAAGRVATLTYPSGKVVSYGYSNGQLTSVAVDGSVIAGGIGYAPFGAVTHWTWGSGAVYSRSYDGFGRLSTYPLGADTRVLTYDDAGRITAMTHLPTAALDESFGYDNLDRLTQAVSPTVGRGYSYDLSGNRTEAIVGGNTDTYTTEAASNRLTAIAGAGPRSFSYDALGNLTGNGSFSATYDARGRLRTLTVGTGTTTYTYDALGRRIRKSGGAAGTVLYVYDDDGRLLGEYTSGGLAVQEFVWLGELPLAVLTRAETLRDNPAGTNVTYVGTWATATAPTGFYGSNYQTHPAAAGSPDSVTWNLAVATGSYKVYARWPASATHSAAAVYRITHATGSTDVTVNQQTDGAEWNLLGTFDLTSANSKVTLLPSADGIVAADAVKAVSSNEATRIFYVHADHLGTPRAVLDTQNRLRWRWISEAFGMLPPETNPQGLGAFTLNLRLPGQVFDLESGLHYNFFRDYDPNTGRYVQSDPIGLQGGINTYAYVSGNPISYVDPLGLDRWADPGWGGGAGQNWWWNAPRHPLYDPPGFGRPPAMPIPWPGEGPPPSGDGGFRGWRPWEPKDNCRAAAAIACGGFNPFGKFFKDLVAGQACEEAYVRTCWESRNTCGPEGR